MNSWFFGLMLAALPALGGQPERPVAPIVLYTEFQQPPSAAVLEGIQDEIGAIMTPLGMRFEWRALSSAHGDDPVSELAVVRFKGRCDVAGLLPHSISPGALGWTHVSDGAVLPFTDIDCDGIRRFVQSGLIAMRTADRDTAYGRALGRVLAHELFHIFARTQHHSAHGIAKPAYSVEDLLEPQFRFSEADGEEMRALANTNLTTPPPDSTH